MRALRATLLVALSVATISLALADDNDAAKKDLAALQGEWSMVSGTADGMPIPDAMLKNSKRVCKDDELTAIVGGQLIMKAKIALDPSKTPKEIDYDVKEGPNKGKKLLGIYELDGDTFKSCFAAPGKERPADFNSKSGDKRTSTEWKRAKKISPATTTSSLPTSTKTREELNAAIETRDILGEGPIDQLLLDAQLPQ